jgi:hypothetical protein
MSPLSNKADRKQLGTTDLICRQASYLVGRGRPGQRCCWRLNADPLAGRAKRGNCFAFRH